MNRTSPLLLSLERVKVSKVLVLVRYIYSVRYLASGDGVDEAITRMDYEGERLGLCGWVRKYVKLWDFSSRCPRSTASARY